jgi:hypothetical protein
MKLISITFSPRGIAQFLLWIVLGLVSLGVAGQCFKYLSNGRLLAIVGLFDLDADDSIPTWYSSFTLLLCACLLAVIALVRKSYRDPCSRSWGLLAAIFLLMSVDEVARIHEKSGLIVRLFIKNTSGIFQYNWVIIGIPLTLLFLLAYLRFMAYLPAKTRRLFLLAGAIFIGGALGVEMIAGNQVSSNGFNNLTYALITAVEELFEMLGIVVFIYALLSYLRSQLQSLDIHIGISKTGVRVESLQSAPQRLDQPYSQQQH